MTDKKILYFEGAGWVAKGTICNCRIRTAFHLDDGRAVFLEIIGSERTKHSSSEIYRWKYTGFVDTCHYITNDIPNDDCNKHRIVHRDSERFEYTEEAILKYVNSLGASFQAIKILPYLGGYRVFPEKHSCVGMNGYYYGDQFSYDQELTERREMVYKYYYELEKLEGKEYPNFSLWVDEFDSGLLHLMRHFIGKNVHWTIRVDEGGELKDWIATVTEIPLGKYGC